MKVQHRPMPTVFASALELRRQERAPEVDSQEVDGLGERGGTPPMGTEDEDRLAQGITTPAIKSSAYYHNDIGPAGQSRPRPNRSPSSLQAPR